MKVEPYLNFNGRCDEAIEFYKKAVGAKVQMLMRFRECPEPQPNMDPAAANKVMHAALQIGQTTVMASDGRCTGTTKFDGITLAISTATDAEAQKIFKALSEGGQVTMPLNKTFFSSQFGMLADRFGVHWMVLVGQ